MQRLRSLRTKALLGVLAIGAVFFASFWLLLVPLIGRTVYRYESDRAQLYARLVSDMIEGDAARSLVELERIAEQPGIVAMTRETADPVLQAFDATTTYFVHFALFTPEGLVVSRPDKPARVGADRSFDLHVSETVKRQQTYVGPVRISPGGNLAVTAGTPVRRGIEVVGVLSGSLGLPDRNPDLYRDVLNPALPPSWNVLLLSSDGALIARSRTTPPSAEKGVIDTGHHPLLALAKVGRTGPQEYEWEGTDWIGAAVAIQPLHWFVIVEVPRTTLEDAVATTTRRITAVGAVTILALIGLMLLLVARLRHRLDKLTIALDAYGSGVDTPIEPGPGDEVGDALVAFNKMVEDRKAAEEERNDLIAELRDRNSEMERFTYTVSHDLKSPLVTIGSFSRLADEDLEAGDFVRVRRDLTHIREASAKMAILLDQLLELSRIGRIVSPPIETSMAELAADVVAQAKARPDAERVTFVVQPGLPNETVDQVRIREVFQNLVDNAVRFMGDQPAPRIEIGVRTEPKRRVYFVADNGIGIAPEYHEKVFGLFERLNPSLEGTGIGLALVKRIIEAHGGAIWVESKGAGTGSTFCFVLGKSA